MRRLLRWVATPAGFFLLAGLSAINALLDLSLGETTTGVIFAVLAVALFVRGMTRRRAQRDGPSETT